MAMFAHGDEGDNERAVAYYNGRDAAVKAAEMAGMVKVVKLAQGVCPHAYHLDAHGNEESFQKRECDRCWRSLIRSLNLPPEALKEPGIEVKLRASPQSE